ncbi:type ii and iii secretion system protein [Leptolyngbya sp. Heron Island J]|uniref:AMIN domain-containing protein n=1 Tax=Leptolyngbya sp. Heron Island J TaxID=1385935 RepID=UPI0003B9B921|nr:AMIN domain-containing protein [Leptolyngbya sp. Heron Island J]ESA34365.1 type ii and iii secretion system protein [Leptolyngbya sp. Heron Island J]
MKRFFKLGSLIAGGALSVLTAQSAEAAATAIQDVELSTTKTGMELLLATKDGETPQIFAVNRDNVLQADITNAQLALPRSKSYTKQNPTPTINSIQLETLDSNTVRLTIKGTDKAPVVNLEKVAGQGVLVSLDTRPNAISEPSEIPETIETVTDESLLPAYIAQAETDTPDVLVPNPEVIIDGEPVVSPTLNPAPPFLPQAVPPPVGDMAVSEINSGLDVIDLGTAERVPRLVLREATAREALSLLARAAGLNLAFTEAGADGEDSAAANTRVTLDIEDEPVQNVFNYVLQISGLEANRVGRTIFVGPRLPQAARNVNIRSVRLNQVDVATAINFLVFMGAESAFTDQQEITEVVATTDVGEVEEVERTELETNVEVLRADYEDSLPLLRGLEVIGDERTSSVTLVGTPRQVEIATAQLVQLDLRRRQVAINVRVIDVDLNASEEFSAGFGFFDGELSADARGGELDFGIASLTNFAEQFILDLEASIENNQAKIITDPTLIVQEGQDALITLVEQVVSSITVNFTNTDPPRETRTVNFEDVGLNLAINVDRIDDNGFVNMSVAPTISSPLADFNLDDDGGLVTPIATRALSSGLIRVRDGQTLVLSGIIQETDRVTVDKVPILGDLPIIGALFRSTSNSDERRELIVLLTPQILDDSDESVYGYSYTPGEDVRELLGEEE